MTFVRSKTIKDRRYFYLVQNVREGAKTRQRVLAYLGEHSTVKEALDYWRQQVKTARDTASKQHAREMVKKLKQYA